MGFAGYFLIVWDIIKFARSRNIPVGPGRGSAAGSLVAYALRISGQAGPNQLNITLQQALDQEPKLRDLVETDTRVKELMGIARSLEGLARHASTHAAGVVISEGPLTDDVPLYKGANDEIVTQYSMGDVEKIGLVKFDFLGLKTLTMIERPRI